MLADDLVERLAHALGGIGPITFDAPARTAFGAFQRYLREGILAAERICLSDAAVATMANMESSYVDNIAENIDFARTPFPYLWVEWRNSIHQDGVRKTTGIEDAMPKRTGYLIVSEGDDGQPYRALQAIQQRNGAGPLFFPSHRSGGGRRPAPLAPAEMAEEAAAQARLPHFRPMLSDAAYQRQFVADTKAAAQLILSVASPLLASPRQWSDHQRSFAVPVLSVQRLKWPRQWWKRFRAVPPPRVVGNRSPAVVTVESLATPELSVITLVPKAGDRTMRNVVVPTGGRVILQSTIFCNEISMAQNDLPITLMSIGGVIRPGKTSSFRR